MLTCFQKTLHVTCTNHKFVHTFNDCQCIDRRCQCIAHVKITLTRAKMRSQNVSHAFMCHQNYVTCSHMCLEQFTHKHALAIESHVSYFLSCTITCFKVFITSLHVRARTNLKNLCAHAFHMPCSTIAYETHALGLGSNRFNRNGLG